jgi:hypothetical protein
MSNDLSTFTPEIWAREMQTIFFKENVAIALANTEFRDQLKIGDTVNKPYRSHLIVKSYTKGSDITAQDVSGTNEQLTVATAKVVPFYVDDIDALQNKWAMATQYAQDAQRMLNNVLDQVIASEFTSANSDVYAADVGGSGATTPITLSTSNIQQVFTAASRKLDSLNIPQAGRFALIGPRILEVIRLYVGGKDTSMADVIGNNGKIAERFGFELYYSNNLAYSATWTPANQPSDGDTVTIAGVVFTFETSTLTTAGQVKSETSTAVTLDNLVAAINGTGTSGVEYYDLTDANRFKLTQAGIVATDGTTTLGIVGYGDISVAASEANDPWSLQTQHALFGHKGATDLVVQKAPNVEFRMAEKRLGRYVYPWVLYGYKTFADMKDALVDVNILTSAW